ncbi:MAG: hypothetical protein J6B30_04765 [Muribaculaceae bacterium]|nr:hypothetical protein [Muribaculaceae bacterium]
MLSIINEYGVEDVLKGQYIGKIEGNIYRGTYTDILAGEKYDFVLTAK